MASAAKKAAASEERHSDSVGKRTRNIREGVYSDLMDATFSVARESAFTTRAAGTNNGCAPATSANHARHAKAYQTYVASPIHLGFGHERIVGLEWDSSSLHEWHAKSGSKQHGMPAAESALLEICNKLKTSTFDKNKEEKKYIDYVRIAGGWLLHGSVHDALLVFFSTNEYFVGRFTREELPKCEFVEKVTTYSVGWDLRFAYYPGEPANVASPKPADVAYLRSRPPKP